MKRYVILILLSLCFNVWCYAQCTTGNATSCQCRDGSLKCKLLPDITIGRKMLMDPAWYTEYSQTGNGVENGRLRISVATPNLGHGPLTVLTTTTYVCGVDTFYGTSPGTCADGSAPKQLINQRVYSKKGNAMSYYDRPAGTMTYHPTHQHMHVDDWGKYSLRIQTNDPDPLQWPIVATGKKLAFCLMDLSTCSGEYGNCVNANNDTLVNADFPNYGLGGGQYNCSPTMQGISSGYVDYYDQLLDGMWVDIPPGTCNGTYWLVVEIDPYNYFEEENENNNVVAVPITLTQQAQPGSNSNITNLGRDQICDGTSTTLQAVPGSAYLWNNGSTTQSISVTTAGTYTVTVTNMCGVGVSNPYTINVVNAIPPTTQNAYFVAPASTTVAATGAGDIAWYDAPQAGNFLGMGNVFSTPVLNATTTYYAENIETISGISGYCPPADNTIGAGSNHTDPSRYLIFDALTDIELVSVKVYATTAGNRTIELRDQANNVLLSTTVFLPVGESRATLNFLVNKGSDYHLGMAPGASPNLYRNNTGVVYPYDVSGIVSITGSSAGLSFYYFYYDWEVKESDLVCTSARVPATAYTSAMAIETQPSASQLVLYPNPSHDMVTIRIPVPSTSAALLQVLDVQGKVILQQNPHNNGTLITLSTINWAPGTYCVRYECGNNEWRKVLIVE